MDGFRAIITASDKAAFSGMIDATRRCLNRKGLPAGRLREDQFDEAVRCELAMFSADNEYTYHTHPNGDPVPSDVDKRTTNKYRKKYMMIGLVPTRRVVVYEAPAFDRIIGEFSV